MEIGAGNGSENCTRILAEERKWSGVWIDSDTTSTLAAWAIAEPLGVRVINVAVDIENSAWVKGFAPQAFGVLSIDIDGNDYHVWDALCRGRYGLRPALVIIEAQVQKPHDEVWVMPYERNYVWDHMTHETGATIAALRHLGIELGYTYVGKCPDPHSPNLFFVRDDLKGRLDG